MPIWTLLLILLAILSIQIRPAPGPGDRQLSVGYFLNTDN